MALVRLAFPRLLKCFDELLMEGAMRAPTSRQLIQGLKEAHTPSQGQAGCCRQEGHGVWGGWVAASQGRFTETTERWWPRYILVRGSHQSEQGLAISRESSGKSVLICYC